MTLWAVVGFPVWLAASFAAVYTLLYLRGGQAAIDAFGSRGFWLYPVFLGLLAGPVLWLHPESTWLALMPSADPGGWPEWLAMAALAVLCGVLLHVGEIGFIRFTGARPALLVRPAPLPVLLLLSLLVASAEELVWRGFLLRTLEQDLGSLWAAALLSAALFGAHHYYFGWRSVLFKAISALLWTWLALHAGALWPAVLAHLSADVLLWWRSPPTVEADVPGIRTDPSTHPERAT